MYDDLREREFNHLIDQYLTTGTMSSEGYAQATPSQKAVIQVIKRALKRINSR